MARGCAFVVIKVLLLIGIVLMQLATLAWLALAIYYHFDVEHKYTIVTKDIFFFIILQVVFALGLVATIVNNFILSVMFAIIMPIFFILLLDRQRDIIHFPPEIVAVVLIAVVVLAATYSWLLKRSSTTAPSEHV